MKKTLVLGGPGSGKTRHLLKVVEDALRRGVPPEEIAFCSFTRAAVGEARTRACEQFGLQPRDLPYFRTLHSLSFRELSASKGDIVDEGHLAELAEVTGELFSPASNRPGVGEGPAMGRNADPLLTLDHYARTTRTGLRRAWEDHGGEIEWFRLKRFSDAYATYKAERDLMDFTDLLEHYVSSDRPPVPVSVAVLDEAQDLSLLQHAVAEKAFANTQELWVGADDDQAIHHWAGAAEGYLEAQPYDREVLPLSHRLPSNIFDLSQGVAKRISRRFEKPQGCSRRGGLVEWVASVDEVDLASGTWLLLARTRAQLEAHVQLAREQGVVYRTREEVSVNPRHVRAILAYENLRAGRRVSGDLAAEALLAAGVRRQFDEASSYTAAELQFDVTPIWHDALIRIPLDDREYYLACLRRGEKLTDPPRVRIETIHGAKGLESESAVLLTDMTYRTYRGYELDPDSEMRVLFVGLTRASDHLVLVAPQSAYGYAF
jgi:superfamily I DNA/RNA helicase